MAPAKQAHGTAAWTNRRRSERRVALDLDAVRGLCFTPAAARPFRQVRQLAYGALMRRIAFSLVVAFAAYFAQPFWRATQNAIAETRAKPSSISFTPGELAADRDGASLIAVPAPGRYAIRAKSPSGARIELVDMIAGPLDSSGAPGLRDGRIDALLDKGVYKLRVFGAKGASGKTALSAQAFVESRRVEADARARAHPRRRTRRSAATLLFIRGRRRGPRQLLRRSAGR